MLMQVVSYINYYIFKKYSYYIADKLRYFKKAIKHIDNVTFFTSCLIIIQLTNIKSDNKSLFCSEELKFAMAQRERK